MEKIKKRLYLIQASNQQNGHISLPYSIGVLAAYAFNNKIISDEFVLCDLIGEKISIDSITKTIIDPDVVAFSCYIWNFEYSKKIAIRLKEVYPNCTIIFGGHSIPINSGCTLEECEYVDYTIHGEGEIPFLELLLYLCGNIKIENVHNISYRNNKTIEYSYNSECIVQDYPSPYLTGIFEKFYDFENNKYTATLETNRGCPFSCGYCDWGLNSAPLRKMDLAKVLDEIEWMGKHNILTCFGADSNFGLFNRDIKITEKLIEVKNRYGFPRKYVVSFSKKSDERVLTISKMLNKAKALDGATISFQSLNEETLKAIGRTNLSADSFKSLIKKYNEESIPTYSEIILALPLETYDSFLDGICNLVEQGQYGRINVYNLTLLTNSQLNQESNIKKYGIKTIKIPQKNYYCKVNQVSQKEIEYSNIVVETNSLSFEEWVRSKMFTIVLKDFHSYGLLIYIASFLYNEKNISYRSFYERLLDWLLIKNEYNFSAIYKKIEKYYKSLDNNENKNDYSIETYNGFVVPAEEVAFLKQKDNFNKVYLGLEKFIDEFDFNHECKKELYRFQKTVMKMLYSTEVGDEYFLFDFIEYFNDILMGKQGVLKKRTIKMSKEDIERLLLLPIKVFLPENNTRQQEESLNNNQKKERMNK